jgi:hypothetical protein
VVAPFGVLCRGAASRVGYSPSALSHAVGSSTSRTRTSSGARMPTPHRGQARHQASMGGHGLLPGPGEASFRPLGHQAPVEGASPPGPGGGPHRWRGEGAAAKYHDGKPPAYRAGAGNRHGGAGGRNREDALPGLQHKHQHRRNYETIAPFRLSPLAKSEGGRAFSRKVAFAKERPPWPPRVITWKTIGVRKPEAALLPLVPYECRTTAGRSSG